VENPQSANLVEQYINPAWRTEPVRARLCEQFMRADPFPWLVLDEFLRPQFVAELCRGFPPKDRDYDRYCLADDGTVGTDYANATLEVFPPAFQELDRLLRGDAFLRFLGEITGIDGLLDDPEYFGGGIRESQARAFLPAHIDFNYHPRTLSHRRLNLLIYLNEAWEEDWGGAIQVHRDPTLYKGHDIVASFAPIVNRCFLFETSERSWHSFSRLCPPPGRSRRAFTIYYYTTSRPDAERVTLRNTEYVEPPLPARLVEGYVLTAEDVDLLAEAIARRDDRIQMLYRLRAEADGKYAHVWKEYEYYLERTRTLEAEVNKRAYGASWRRRIFR
jgi:hypothetical protein